MKRMLILAAVLLVCQGAPGDEIDYIEDFALARDRTIALQQLIPGTEDYYYYHCLHLQNTQQYERVEQLLQAWIKRYDYTPRVYEIQNRQALLTYNADPQKSLDYLRHRLNLQFNHQRESVGASPELPTTLDNGLIARNRLMKEAMSTHENLDGFEDSALDWLVGAELSPQRRRHLLQRLRRPDYPNLVPLVIDDLHYTGSGGFGSLPIHGLLLLDQLDECVRLKPDLLNQAKFVNTYLARLHPNDDLDLQRDLVARQAHLERLWAFVERLSPTHNSLKIHVLYHRLQFDRERGIFDKPRFMQYIELPRDAGYVSRKYFDQPAVRRNAGDLKTDFRDVTELPPVGNDEPLVSSYLQHFFLTETSYKPYEPYLDNTYLKQTFAETKIVNGLGDAEQWASLLPPEQFQALQQRVDIEFAATNREYFSEGETVHIDLYVKNVPKLIVKVYEINTYNFYRQLGKEVNTDINLDGLVANLETTYQYDQPPLRRVARHFEFDELEKPGVYVVDFIGNGRSSRAVIRKGRLQYLARTSTAGHVFTILNEENKKVMDGSLWLAGHEYRADQEGLFTVPFSTQPKQQPIVLTHGGLSSLDTFRHDSENYALKCGIYVDRESLIARRQAKVAVRPALYLNGTPVTLSVLEDVRLIITSTDLDGVASVKEISDFRLFEDRESVYEFQVPERLQTIQFQVGAKVHNVSLNQEVDLRVGTSFQLNGIDKTDKVEDLHLMNVRGKYVLELLGKTGEPRANRPVRLSLKHRDFKTPVQVTLRSNDAGQVLLGPLDDLATITATGPTGITRNWPLRHDQFACYQTLHGQEGQILRLPYTGQAKQAAREEFSLIELRGGKFVADRFDSLKLAGGMLELTDLSRGDYDLLLKRRNRRLRVKIAAGTIAHGYVLGDHRQLELPPRNPLQISEIALDDGQVVIQLAGASKFARLHIFATRYEPAYGVFDYLGSVRDREPYAILRSVQPSLFASGRKLGDEYRYIIDRKYAARYPGNMLERPSLLLNPWAVRKTETGTQEAAAGNDFAPETPAPPSRVEQQQQGEHGAPTSTDSPNLDFLADSAAVLLNLRPDDDGVILIDRAQLAPYQQLWAVAIDPRSTVCRSIDMSGGEQQFVDLRMDQGLDPEQHFSQQKRMEAINKGEQFQLADVGTARFEVYDSLSKVHSLMVTLTGNTSLMEFAFVLEWDDIDPEARREKYSKYACHELNFFLYHKDRQFFEAVVRPYLRHKKDKTFLDHWLIDDDLRGYLEPWQYAQLNVAERILLAQRVKADLPHTRRSINDMFDLTPPNEDRFNFLFETAVQRSVLGADDELAKEFSKQKEATATRRGLAVMGKDVADMPSDALGRRAEFGTGKGASGYAGGLKAPAEDRGTRAGVLLEAQPADDSDGAAVEKHVDAYFARDASRRNEARRFYRQLDKTQEWAENNYYQLPLNQRPADLVKVNGFWRDLANHDPQRPFLSTHFAEATSSFAEMMLALALLDLPLKSGEHDFTVENRQLQLVPGTGAVVFHEQIEAASLVAEETPILVSQNFYRHRDRYRYLGNQKVDKYVTDEFLVQTVYGCQIVVTNPTSSPQKLAVLLQIPEGSLPVLNGKRTRTVNMGLEPFHTATLEYYFYFPMPGSFAHYPVHVSKNDQILAAATPVKFNVVEQLSKIDRQSWAYLSQYGSNEEVLEFLKTKNLQRLDLAKIAFRMHDKAFFEDVIRLLASNHVYDPVLWSYGIKHDAPAAIQVYLEHQDQFVNQCGAALDSPLLTIDPVARGTYQHLEYRPLVNARAHQLGQRRQIVNSRMSQQYHALLKLLSYERKLNDDQLMAVTYFMLLQDRVEEAIKFFTRVNPENLASRMQYDYFTAYLDFYTDDPQLAGPIAARYAEFEVPRWRKAFQAIAAQLEELHGDQAAVVDSEDLQQSQVGLAATEPEFEFVVEARKIRIDFQNLAQVQVNYYLMDVELLFSRNPFVQKYSGQFSMIQPNRTAKIDLPEKDTSYEFELPADLHNGNVLVEISAAGKTRSQAYYANSLAVQIVESYGQLRVTHQETGKPVPKAYVKVYARTADGRVRFYKDGYTDLRGRFDYTSLSTNELDSVQKFALLVLSDTDGAVVREADPPKR